MNLKLTADELRNLILRPTIQEMAESPLAVNLRLIVDGQPNGHDILTMRGHTVRLILPDGLTMASRVEIKVR